MKIGTLAKKVGLHTSTIRRYIKDGKIAEPDRDINGWRVFSDEHIAQIRELQGKRG